MLMTIILELLEASQEDAIVVLLLFCYYSDSKFYDLDFNCIWSPEHLAL